MGPDCLYIITVSASHRLIGSAMSILVGTASWTDKSLIGCARFYPKQATSAEARLRYYASQFPMVEVDSSYYAMPSAHNAQLWAERTPSAFIFNVKAFRLFTGHPAAAAVLPRDIARALEASPALAVKKMLYYRDLPPELRAELWRRFLLALDPLQRAGKLGAVHFQFAPWLVRSRTAQTHVAHCVQMMPDHTLAVEFRHRSWFEGEHAAQTLAFERELQVVHVVVDAPPGFDNSVSALWDVTHPALAVVRLHGRNTQTWNQPGLTSAADRFNYDYREAELGALASHISALSSKVQQLQVVFNNNHEDQGQRNAKTLMRLLGSQRQDDSARVPEHQYDGATRVAAK